MNYLVRLILLSIILMLSSSIVASPSFLSGDEKYSCEAILCLSTGQPPSECSPALDKYFSIKAKKLSKTIRKRKKFLEICPEVEYDGKDAHLSALAEGGGRCDMQSLLSYLNGGSTKQGVPFISSSFANQPARTIPAYCQTLFDNPYTDSLQLPVQQETCEQVSTPIGFTNRCRTIWVDPNTLSQKQNSGAPSPPPVY